MPPALRDAVMLGVVAGFALTAVAGRALGSQYTPVTAERFLNPEPCNGRGRSLGRGPG